MLDVCVSGFLLVLGSPLFLVVALAVLADGKGQILFRQQRVGKGQRLFNMYKFRTMVVNAEQVGPKRTAHHDPRITKVGRLLRKTSLDELPQLVNVFKGDLSLVGPRPCVAEQIAENSADFLRRFEVAPGMTGLAQVRGRSRLTPEQKLACDLEYVQTHSVWLDVKILFQTFWSLFGRGSN